MANGDKSPEAELTLENALHGLVQHFNPGAPGHQASQDAVDGLIKQALDAPDFVEISRFLDFARDFRRLSVWNARMAYIQRPGARVIASEYEWRQAGRSVADDARPIIILWPFGPIRLVYELADTLPPVDRAAIGDPFAVAGTLPPKAWDRLIAALVRQKQYSIFVDVVSQGFNLAGSVGPMGQVAGSDVPLKEGPRLHAGSAGFHSKSRRTLFRVRINARLTPPERFVTLAHELGHVFCGHLGRCQGTGRQDESGWPDRQGLSIAQQEVEAESVAYLVASRAGLTTGSPAYLKPYATFIDPAKVNVDLIVRAAARVERLAKLHHGQMWFEA